MLKNWFVFKQKFVLRVFVLKRFYCTLLLHVHSNEGAIDLILLNKVIVHFVTGYHGLPSPHTTHNNTKLLFVRMECANQQKRTLVMRYVYNAGFSSV